MTNPKPSSISTWSPSGLAVLLGAEFVGLIAVFFLWFWDVIPQDRLPAVIGGVLPIVVPWAGAMGGVTMGMFGLAGYWKNFDHTDDAKRTQERREWNAWYLFRLPLGMAMGTFAAMATVFVTAAITVTDEGSDVVSSEGIALLAVIAFAFGYRQTVFKDLIDRVFEVVVGPGEKPTASTDVSLDKSSLDFSAAVNDESATQAVTVRNTGTRFVMLDDDDIKLRGADATSFKLVAKPGGISPDGSAEIQISYAPTASGEHEASLVVSVGSRTRTVKITGKTT